MMNQQIAATANDARQFALEIANFQNGLSIPAGDRHRIPGALADISLEHQDSIMILLSAGNFGSAFALVRPLYETFVTSIWLHRCATDKEIEDYIRDKHRLPFRKKVVAISKASGITVLQEIVDKHLRAMHSFVHGGQFPIARRIMNDSIKPNFSPDELNAIIHFSNVTAACALVLIAELSGDEDIKSGAGQLADSIIGRSAQQVGVM